jgi:hypothetical protein
MYGMILFIVLSVFIAGLMVGRTPEYIGKKIEAHDVKLAMLAVLILAFCILAGTAAAAITAAGTSSLNNAGPHGLSHFSDSDGEINDTLGQSGRRPSRLDVDQNDAARRSAGEVREVGIDAPRRRRPPPSWRTDTRRRRRGTRSRGGRLDACPTREETGKDRDGAGADVSRACDDARAFTALTW